jgi:polysaccharide pyruvyl transferase WcaK-like protein
MKVLVYGWYHQLNIGDELFIDCFKKLFPTFDLVFQDNIKSHSLDGIDAVFFGGGSFLGSKPNISDEALEILKKKPIFYLGVGVEPNIHPTHMELIRLARLVAIRSADQVDRVASLNPNTMWIPDLVYSLQSDISLSDRQNRSILVMPNISVVPHHMDPYWMHASWNHFKSEFSQFLDDLVQDNYKISFLAMCQGNKDNDNLPAAELIGHMSYRNNYILNERPVGIKEVTSIVSKYSLVITQRFHGIVLSEMTKTPYIALHHHDKLKFSYPRSGAFVSYYNSSKHLLLDTFDHTIRMKFSDSLPIESNIFETLSQKVIRLI